MIKSIKLKNFFSFASQEISFGNLNALVGINGAGKSNLIKALQVLKAVIGDGDMSDLLINQWGGYDAIMYMGNTEPGAYIQIEYEFNYDILALYGYHFQEPVFYSISFHKVASSQNYYLCESFHTDNEGRPGYRYLQIKRGKGFVREGRTNDQTTVTYELDNFSESILSQLVDKDRYYQIYTLREAIKDIAIYTNFNTMATSPIRKPVLPGFSNRLTSDGANLPQVLNAIKVNDKPSYGKITDAITSVNANFKGFDFNYLGTSIELLLDETGLNKAIHVTHISDGTLRYLCLLAIIFNPRRGKLVCIDEPEVGLHPDMLSELIQAIMENAERTQYIISTHSNLLLNQLPVSDVIVFEKDGLNSSVVRDFRDKEFVEWARQYSTGTLWRNGDLGGNRY
ncbi:MAG: AAA family ATPase [Bacteroidales bacterium]|nr:AAA family ATPase [Bacteroidales bacterium]